jgi:hypothetical protein
MEIPSHLCSERPPPVSSEFPDVTASLWLFVAQFWLKASFKRSKKKQLFLGPKATVTYRLSVGQSVSLRFESHNETHDCVPFSILSGVPFAEKTSLTLVENHCKCINFHNIYNSTYTRYACPVSIPRDRRLQCMLKQRDVYKEIRNLYYCTLKQRLRFCNVM